MVKKCASDKVSLLTSSFGPKLFPVGSFLKCHFKSLTALGEKKLTDFSLPFYIREFCNWNV
jgi:hypothetical protein